jgi:hypothetical protein
VGSRETFLELPEPLERATDIRGSVIVNSQMEVRARGHEDRYWERVPEPERPALRTVIAPTWVPMRLALVHYRAMEALRLPRDEIVDIGGAAALRLQKSFIGTLIRSSRDLGAKPEMLLGRLDRIVGRAVRGGGVCAERVGLKDGRIELHAIPIADVPYVRAGWEGMILQSALLVAKAVRIRELPRPGPEAAAYLISWV